MKRFLCFLWPALIAASSGNTQPPEHYEQYIEGNSGSLLVVALSSRNGAYDYYFAENGKVAHVHLPFAVTKQGSSLRLSFARAGCQPQALAFESDKMIRLTVPTRNGVYVLRLSQRNAATITARACGDSAARRGNCTT